MKGGERGLIGNHKRVREENRRIRKMGIRRREEERKKEEGKSNERVEERIKKIEWNLERKERKERR